MGSTETHSSPTSGPHGGVVLTTITDEDIAITTRQPEAERFHHYIPWVAEILDDRQLQLSLRPAESRVYTDDQCTYEPAVGHHALAAGTVPPFVSPLEVSSLPAYLVELAKETIWLNAERLRARLPICVEGDCMNTD